MLALRRFSYSLLKSTTQRTAYLLNPVAKYHSSILSKTLQQKYAQIDTKNRILAYYIWVDGTGENVRGKTRTLDFVPEHPDQLPMWNFDGSSTGQAEGHDSDVLLKPVKVYADPFRGGNHKLVLCEALKPDGTPAARNERSPCMEAMEKVIVNYSDEGGGFFHLKFFDNHSSYCGRQLEYTFLGDDGRPFGWPKNGFPAPQGPYYCGIGASKVFGREIVEAHYRACIHAGLDISGTNAEVMPAQWEFQIGPVSGTEIGDQMWLARYLLWRVAEDFGVQVSLHPKPLHGDWNGAGCHCNFSTEAMRSEGGLETIKEACNKLAKRHMTHQHNYDPTGGVVNQERMTGLHETASFDKFSFGVADRGASVRIPRMVFKNGRGYLEDRRPSSNCDPYLVTGLLVRTCLLNETD